MPLTPAILSYLEGWPDELAGKYCLEFLRAQDRGAPVEEAHEEALRAAETSHKGLNPSGTTLTLLDRERWLRDAASALWGDYLSELGEYAPELVKKTTKTQTRERMIRRAMGWWRQDKRRSGRPPMECVRDQIRGRFAVISADEPGPNSGRVDPEYIFGRHSRARKWALAWWALEAFPGSEVEANER